MRRFLLILLASSAASFGHTPKELTSIMTKAASQFLGSLDDRQKKLAQFPFESAERENWNYVPTKRDGISLKDLTVPQEALAKTLLKTGLSDRGLLTATQIIELEELLYQRSGKASYRDPEKYYVTIFGEPSTETPWGWRFEGHHLSVNISLVGNHLQATPSFYGTNPAEVRSGPKKSLRPLGDIEDAARKLVQELVEAGSKQVVFSKKPPSEILTRSSRQAKPLKTAGLSSQEMSDAQFKELLELIELVANFHQKPLHEDSLRRLSKDHRREARFAWAGSQERGGKHYFRIQCPDFLIEYANTQNDGNHAHLVWRDFDGDFGRDLLREHFKKDHQE